jgi:hypothetical protein
MLRTAVVLAALGVLLLVGSFFMPGKQVTQQRTGWVVALKAKAGELVNSLAGGKNQAVKLDSSPALTPAVIESGAPPVAAAIGGKIPPQVVASDAGGEGTKVFEEPRQVVPVPPEASRVVEPSPVAPVHESGEASLTDQVPQADSNDEDAESATEVLERVGRKIHGRRG